MDIDRQSTLKDAGINQKAEGKIFPGLPQSEIKSNELRVFKFNCPQQLIVIETHEYVSKCEYSGISDFGTLKIEYYPTAGRCLELKALKYYMLSFQQILIFQEKALKRIFTDLKKITKSSSIKVTLTYRTRGGFDTTCTIGKL